MILRFTLIRRHSRVERRAPAAIEDVDIRRRIDSRHHCPQDFFQIRRIDVFIDDDDIATIARSGGTTYRCQTGLLCVAGVFLLNRHDGKIRRMIIDADDVLNS
jgi:hypothetical protein